MNPNIDKKIISLQDFLNEVRDDEKYEEYKQISLKLLSFILRNLNTGVKITKELEASRERAMRATKDLAVDRIYKIMLNILPDIYFNPMFEITEYVKEYARENGLDPVTLAVKISDEAKKKITAN